MTTVKLTNTELWRHIYQACRRPEPWSGFRAKWVCGFDIPSNYTLSGVVVTYDMMGLIWRSWQRAKEKLQTARGVLLASCLSSSGLLPRDILIEVVACYVRGSDFEQSTFNLWYHFISGIFAVLLIAYSYNCKTQITFKHIKLVSCAATPQQKDIHTPTAPPGPAVMLEEHVLFQSTRPRFLFNKKACFSWLE